MLNIEDREVAVIGGGEVAFRKAAGLIQYNPKLKVISPDFIDKFQELKDKVELIKAYYSEELIEESFMVVAATSSKDINASIARFCRENKILCNIVDDIELSDFIVPSSVNRGSLIISVSTQGKSPALASRIRKELEERYDESYEDYLNLLGEIRDLLQKKCDNIASRKKILNDILDLSLEELINLKKAYETASKIYK